MKQQKINIAFKQESNQSLEIYGNWLMNEGNEGILTGWFLHLCKTVFKRGLKAKASVQLKLKSRTKVLSSGVLTRPYLSARAKVTTGPPHSISRTSTGSMTRQGFAFASSGMHNTCSHHNPHAAPSHSPAHTEPPRCCSTASMDKQSIHPMDMGGYRPPSRMQTRQHTFQSGSTTKPQAWELDQTAPKPPNLVPATRQVCKWPASPKKRRLGKSLCQKPSKTDIPDQLCAFTAFLGTTSGVKWWKETSAEESQSCPPFLAAPPR